MRTFANPRRAPASVFLGLGLCALLTACGTTARSQLSSVAALPGPAERADLRAEAQLQSPTAAQATPAAAKAADGPDLSIAMVAGEPIDVRSFLARTWIRSSDVSREILDRLVVERLALLEAERQDIAVSQTRVDERLEVAWKALGDSLVRQGRGVSIAEHLRRELGVDTEYYRRQLRREAIAQLIAERVVRSWASSRERCEIVLVELDNQAALDAFSAGLAAGRDYDSLAKELHRYREKEPNGARIKLIRNDNTELSRVAFTTSAGQVAGPLKVEEGRFLMLRVERAVPAIVGEWKDIGTAIEESLTADPVDDLEFVQWRAEMVKSYSVDLDPFFRLIGVSRELGVRARSIVIT
jgi:hypothetical protein